MTALLRRLVALALASLALFGAAQAAAQTTVTADWTNLNKANLQAVSNGSALAIGPNTVTINTRVNRDGDTNDSGFQPYYSTEMLAYYSGQLSSFTGGLLYSTDHSVFDPGDYFETTFTLASSVTNMRFTIGNMDRYFTSPYFFHDAVVVEYDTGTGTWQNLRSLAGSYTLGSAVGTTTINGQNGFHGTAYSGGITSTSGDIRVDFGATTVKRVRIRYLFGQGSPTSNPSGDYQYIGLSDFTWTQTGVSVADLSLTKTVSNATPAPGSTVSYTLNLSNAGTASSSNVVVSDLLPTGFNFQSASGYGTYNPSTGLWTIASIASGQTRSLTITGTVTAPTGVTIVNSAEVYSTTTYDPDSSPNNGSTTEDDDASASFTVSGTRSAGVAPALTCPVGTNIFDWDVRSWTAGSTTNSYPMANFGTVQFAISTNGIWVSDPTFGGLSPTLSSANSGGLATPQLSLHQYLDFADRFQTATTTISLPTGVAGAQFTIFDVDYAVNDFADKLTVVGSYRGATVIPTLTNGVVNYVVGNTAIGDGGATESSADGNVVVTFSQPVDTITIIYGNASTAPVNPDGQAIALHDILLCKPATTLAVSKTSTVVSDPVNASTNPKAIPGAQVEYSILVTNTGVSAADGNSIEVVDDIPTDVKMCVSSFAGTGPVLFTDGSPSSTLSYSFVDLANAADSLQFSNDAGASWTYVPTADGDGCDSAITNFRVTPVGSFASGGSFTLNARFIVK